MKVLYVDGAGPFGGAARSLHELVKPLVRTGGIEAYFIMQNGTATRYYREVAKDLITVPGLTRFDNTLFSYYRGLRWLILLREVYHFPFSVFAVARARLKWGRVDVIHANEILDVVPALLARLVFRAPLVIHVRSLQRPVTDSLRARVLSWCLNRLRARIVAIDSNVSATLDPSLRARVIHNSFTPTSAMRDERLSERLSRMRPGSLKVAFVGSLHVSKGILELVEAMRLLRSTGHNVECVVAGGETRRDRGVVAVLLAWVKFAQNVGGEVSRRVEAYGLQDSFHLLGPVDDITSVYRAVHVVAFPSHFDAPGRPVLEAALSGVPSIVCVRNPQPDTLEHGETGLAIPPRDAEALAAAIAMFDGDRSLCIRMGDKARRLAQLNCDPAKNAEQVFAVYCEAVSTDNSLRRSETAPQAH